MIDGYHNCVWLAGYAGGSPTDGNSAMDDQNTIWKSIQNIRKIGHSIAAFWDALPMELSRIGSGNYSVNTWDGRLNDLAMDPNDWVYIEEYRIYDLKKRARGRQRLGYISIRIELWRDVNEESDWEYAKKPLIYVGFTTPDDSPWDNTQMRLDQRGEFSGECNYDNVEYNVWRSSCLPPLWEINETETKNTIGQTQWDQRAWFFALPLYEIRSRENIEEKIVNPVNALLFNTCPDAALRNFRQSFSPG